MLRKVIALRGNDTVKVLQSLCTNDVAGWESGLLATAFLTNKGRVLCDAILYRTEDSSVLVDVAAESFGGLVRHLKMYKLRAQVSIEATDLAVSRERVGEVLAGGTDPRVSGLGERFVSSERGPAPEVRSRLAVGVSEGPEIVGRIPLECNLDAINAISFSKGCYLGQELTARAKHRGAVRKRLMPLVMRHQALQVMAEIPPCEEAPPGKGEDKVLAADGATIGTVVAADSGVVLALLRLDAAFAPEPHFSINGRPASPYLPPWWLDAHLAAREDGRMVLQPGGEGGTPSSSS
ncbi:hypothetical protein CTAYLR_006255 [Chrysophaeum taylorii]|uniref:CAF17 C-terminal domain-containing protein n=1 Tax=Chrysophaeum taylorii TaxID=2483200 RepID=A0AAD7UHY6_9STRA|nr:hypothetical protein CTAYLR_006255 [Chrysophaeum taylorii]